jgi:hypothetical protein
MRQLTEHVVPVVLLPLEGPPRLHGTAFFINHQGTFLTATHVLQAAVADAAANGGSVSLLVPDAQLPGRLSNAPVRVHDPAPAPYDVSVGETGIRSAGAFAFFPGMLREKHLKVEEYGVADDLRPLFSWQPPCLNGRTLAEVNAY